MNPIRKFIYNNRQLGSTTALVKAAMVVDGYVVVGSYAVKGSILKHNLTMSEKRVLVIADLYNGFVPIEPRPIFFDATALEFFV